MTDAIHPNMSILKKLDLQNLDACKSILANDFVWHYFNPRIPDLEGDYRGVEGLKKFFAEKKGSNRINREFGELEVEPRFSVNCGSTSISK